MVEPPQQPSPSEPPSPFHPAGVPARPPGTSGCSKPLLLGCGGLLALLGIGLVLLIFNAPKIVQWSFHTMEEDLKGRLGPDVTAEDRARLAAAFEGARQAMGKNQIDITKVQAFQGKILEIAPATRPLSHKDVQELARLLEDMAGTPSPGPSPAERERGTASTARRGPGGGGEGAEVGYNPPHGGFSARLALHPPGRPAGGHRTARGGGAAR